MKKDMRYTGYSETDSKDCNLPKRVQQTNKNKIEGVQNHTIFMPPFVDTKEQSTASMLTGYTSKINLDLSTATSPIDSEIINQSVVTYPIDLENSN